MIIDTESPEGKALVALAKFGHRMLDEHYFIFAEEHGLVSYDRHAGIWIETDLAKLPEGL